MRVRSVLGYPSYEAAGLKFEKRDFIAVQLSKAVKGAAFRGYADVTIDGRRHRVTHDNTRPALDLFGSRVTKWTESAPRGTAVFVLPSSSCTAVGVDEKASRIVQAIQRAGCPLLVAAPFFWARAMQRAADGGERDSLILKANLRFTPTGEGITQAVLIDDVMTTGGHLKAAAWLIQENGITPWAGITFARTVRARAEDILATTEEDLPI